MNDANRAITLNEWLDQASIPDLEAELAEKQADLDGRLEKLRDLEQQAIQLHEEINRHRKMLDVLTEVRPPGESNAADGGHEVTAMSKREMAERILRASLTPLFPRQVRDIAVEKGWLENTPNASNQLTVAINKAYRQKKLAKDEDGRYFVPRKDTEPSDSSPGPASNGDPRNLAFPVEPGGGEDP
jgi:hypothetical protein